MQLYRYSFKNNFIDEIYKRGKGDEQGVAQTITLRKKFSIYTSQMSYIYSKFFLNN